MKINMEDKRNKAIEIIDYALVEIKETMEKSKYQCDADIRRRKAACTDIQTALDVLDYIDN